jgi:two-component system cell cycle sensor histidine kinase/response regulator CckA
MLTQAAILALAAIVGYLLAYWLHRRLATAHPKKQNLITLENSSDPSALYLEFFYNTPIPTIVIDSEARVTVSNPALRRLIGASTQLRATGWSIHEMIASSDHPTLQHTITSIHQQGTEATKPTRLRLQGDEENVVLLYGYKMPVTFEGATRLVLQFIDMTEQHRLEQRLAHSQKMQAVGQLAGGIAHDFNNLLTAIIGFCDLLLQNHPPGDPSFADLMQIKQNSNRAANLVRQLLAFSRKQTLQPTILNITDVLAELSHLMRRLVGEKIELSIHHGDGLRLIRVDQGQLEQVVMNLVVNARDAMPQGGKLTIRTSNVHITSPNDLSRDLEAVENDTIEPGDYIQLDVIDTGHGIPKHLLNKIFEPFFSTKEIGAGTGLGLATVYGIVKQTGGYIYIHSKLEQGTVFSIFLKAQDKAAITAKAMEEQELPTYQLETEDLTGTSTILLVEDEDPVRTFISHALTNKGYKVLQAESAETALKIIATEGKSINLIISDIIMPGMNGPALVERIAAEYPGVKVIFISGYAEDDFITTLGGKTQVNFLSKPFTLKQIAEKVKLVLADQEIPQA